MRLPTKVEELPAETRSKQAGLLGCKRRHFGGASSLLAAWHEKTLPIPLSFAPFSLSLHSCYNIIRYGPNKTTPVGVDIRRAEASGRPRRHALLCSQADGTMALHQARADHSGDDQHLATPPRSPGAGVRGRPARTHRSRTLRGWYSEVPLPSGNLRCRIRLHPR